ncbi:MAG: diaminopimelate epimerase [Bacteroidales bacterium]|nr:diaminopimelate epimerase [Bacteroidales bacterium]
MKLKFYKYQATGNDFIIIDNRNNIFDKNNPEIIRFLCNRRFGIGADGVILIENHPELHFSMKYFNSNGNEGTMCGNGGRCSVSFSNHIGLIDKYCEFEAIDGIHHAEIISSNYVKLELKDVNKIEEGTSHFYLNTGSPHYVKFINNIKQFKVYDEGKKIRYNDRFKKLGTNVDFVEIFKNFINVRTYERGVENETLSCGTGVVASALSYFLLKNSCENVVKVVTKGGNIKVSFEYNKNKNLFNNIWLEGAVENVFKGEIDI